MGLSYGGVSQKHDWIDLDGKNYIDVKDESSSYILDFIGFNHFKNGVAMELYNPDRVIDMPDNLVKVEDI